MKFSIKKSDFSNGFDIPQFYNEIKGIVNPTKIDTTENEIIIISDSEITDSNKTLVMSVVGSHDPYIPTDLETKAVEIIHAEDYFKERGLMREYFNQVGWGGLTNNEKEIAAKYCLADDMTIIGFYMGQGLDQTAATTKHLVRRAVDINNASKVCEVRSKSPVVQYIAIKHLTEDDAATFLDAVRDFITDYATIAHFGLNYNQSREGIMDYIEATNAYTGGGLSTYTFRTGSSYEACRDELKEFLLNGNKPTEFDVFSV